MSFFQVTPSPPAGFIVCAMFVAGALLGLLSATVQAQEVEPSSTQRADINELLAEDLAQATAPVSFLVVLRDQPDSDRPARRCGGAGGFRPGPPYGTLPCLDCPRQCTQAPLRAWLDACGVRYTPHYLVKTIQVQGDQVLAEQLRLRPEVDRLARNPAVRQSESMLASTLTAAGRYGRFLRHHPLKVPLPIWRAAGAIEASVVPTQLPHQLAYTHADEKPGLERSWPGRRRRQPGYRG